MALDYGLLSDGVYPMIAIVLALVYFTNTRKTKKSRSARYLALGIAALVATFAVVTLLKMIFPEARPLIAGMDSFPSRHAAMAFAAAALGHLVRTKRKEWVQGGLYFWATAISAARVLGGFHWPHDVIAGAAIGWAIGFFVIYLAKRRI